MAPLTLKQVINGIWGAAKERFAEKTRFNDLSNKVTNISGDVTSLKTDNSTNKTDIASLKSGMTSVESAVADLESTVDEKLDSATAASTYAKKSDITTVYRYKGSVPVAELPTSSNEVGDTYDLQDDSDYGVAGTNVAWDGTKWDALAGKYEFETMTQEELDAILV